ncbi:MAG: hypothetical protein [Arizlama microvirus]|nr:MAG: hypothetical protein [Arizlama microvirus]
MRNIRNSMNYEYDSQEGEINTDPSATVPNQSMTVLEMISRYRRGLPLDGAKFPVYNGEEALPDISDLDLADQQKIVEAYADQLVDIKNRLSLATKNQKEKQRLDEIEAEVKKRLKNLSAPPKPKDDVETQE